MSNNIMRGLWGRRIKRLFDLSASAVGLAVLSPVLAALALAVRVKLGRPVFFRQVRPGFEGQPFTLYKFRTMTDEKDVSGRLLPDAARITRLGRLLRLTSLDELPALVNVFRGEMSLVGPRPLSMTYLERYTPEQARRHEVHMITSYRKPTAHKTWFETEETGIRVHWLPVPYSNAMSYAERVRAFSHFAFAAGPKASKIGGDVVFATSTPLTIAIPGVYASKRLRVPMVFEVRDLWPELPIAVGAIRNPILKRAAHRLESFAYRNSSQIVALSPGMRDGVVSTGYPEDRVHVIPNSSDVDRFRGPGVDGNRFLNQHPYLQGRRIVLYAGTFGKINGVDYVVRLAVAMRRLDENVAFVLVGRGQQKSIVTAAAESLGVLDKNVFILPAVPKHEMPDVFAAADVATSLFIDLPAMWHNSANKFFDALAAGKPIMINYEGWQAEIIREHGVGVVAPPGEPQEAARLVAEFLNDSERLKVAKQNAAQLADEEFDRDLQASRLLRVLEEAARS